MRQANYLNRHIVNDTSDSFRVTRLEGHPGDRGNKFKLSRRKAKMDKAIIRSKPFDREGRLADPDRAFFHLEIVNYLRYNARPEGL